MADVQRMEGMADLKTKYAAVFAFAKRNAGNSRRRCVAPAPCHGHEPAAHLQLKEYCLPPEIIAELCGCAIGFRSA